MSRRIVVPVIFTGTVEVDVPDSAPNAELLAEKMALCRILATCENPDASELEAFEEYAEEIGGDESDREREWDVASIERYGGAWAVNQNPREGISK